MKAIKEYVASAVWLAAITLATFLGLVAWVFFHPKPRCPKCGRKMKHGKTDESFGVWICKECSKKFR